MRKIAVLLTLITLLLLPAVARCADQGSTILRKANEAFANAGGIEADFTVSSSAGSTSGKMTVSGQKFALKLNNGHATWYDGKSLWTYNPTTKEVTVSTPTAADLETLNPWAVLKNAGIRYYAKTLDAKEASQYRLLLTPRSRKDAIRRVEVFIDKKTYHPHKIVVTPTSGQPVTVMVGKLTTGLKPAASVFTFPKSKYPKTEIIDIR